MIAPLLITDAPICTSAVAVPGFRLRVVPALMVMLPHTLNCPLRLSVLLFVVLSITVLGAWPWARKTKLVAVALVPKFSVAVPTVKLSTVAPVMFQSMGVAVVLACTMLIVPAVQFR